MAAFAGLTTANAEAHASAFSVARFGGEHGHPTTRDPTALYFNPAALRSQDAQLFADLLVAHRRATYTRESAETDEPLPDDAADANRGRATLNNVFVGPSLWAAVPLGDWVFAAGLFTPFGAPVSWSKRDQYADSPYPGPVDGVTRFHSIEGMAVTSYASVGASYALGRFRLGLALNLLYTWVQDTRAWSAGGNSVVGEGRSLLDVSGFAWSFAAGAFYESADGATRFGASYQSRPNVAGGMRLSGSLDNDIGGPSSADVELIQDLPDIMRLGVTQRLDGVELRLFGAWERWSAFERQCVVEAGTDCAVNASGAQRDGGAVLSNVPRDFRDAFEIRGGASVWPAEGVEVFSGIGFMSSAVPDATFDASYPDFPSVSFAVGSRVRVSHALALGASLNHVLFVPRDVDSRLASYELPTRQPDASGHYTQSVSFVDVNALVSF